MARGRVLFPYSTECIQWLVPGPNLVKAAAVVGPAGCDRTVGYRQSQTRRPLRAARGYVLVTLHRPSPIDSSESLSPIVGKLRDLSSDRVVTFAAHPRTIAERSERRLSSSLNGR